MTTAIRAHFDGKHSLVLDEPVDLPVGKPLWVRVEAVEEALTPPTTGRLPVSLEAEAIRALAANPQNAWQPLDVEIDPELGRTIAEDPQFNIEES
jgi:hypothetical protein